MTSGVKISALLSGSPAAALSDADGFEITQGSDSKGATAAQILAYVNANGNVQTVPTLAALKALTTRPRVVIGEDGASYGPFRWASGSTLTADDQHVVTPTTGEAGRFLRITNGFNAARTTGLSNYMQLATKGINVTLDQTIFGVGYNALSMLTWDIVDSALSVAAKNPTGLANLDYLAMDDNFLSINWTEGVVINSYHPLRHPATDTTQNLDIAPAFFLNRRVSNALPGSNLGTYYAQGIGSMVKGVLTGTDPFAVTNGSPTVTVSLTNHNLTVGEKVYFPVQVTGRGITLGGLSDTASNNNNKYGSYYVQTVPNGNSITITAAMNATSTGSFGGSNVHMDWPQKRKTMSNNPFTTNGTSTVTVAHTNHQLSPASGTNPGNPRASTGNPSHVFYEGATAVGGATIKGDHVVQTCPDANSYTITINAIQDVTAAPTAATGGGTPTYSHGASNIDLMVAAWSANILDSNANDPAGQWQLCCGSPPNYGAGFASMMVLGSQGGYATYLDPLSSPGEGGLHFRKLLLTSPASTDNYLEIKTTTIAQAAGIKFWRGTTSNPEKINIVADASDLFRFRDVVNSVNFLSYNLADANMSIGWGGGTITAKGAINYAADAQASDTYVITLTPTPTAYFAGMDVTFKANTANTGAATINVNGLGAKTIVKAVSTTLADNDILASMLCVLKYDGTNFVLINPRTL